MKLLWKPDAERIKNANISKYINFVNQKYNLNLNDYADLYEWSISDYKNFWASFAEFALIKFHKPYENVIENEADFPPKTKWFVGAKLNFAENLLKFNDNYIAIDFINEQGDNRTYSYKELREEVATLSNALTSNGAEIGDRMVAYMPNIPETLIAMLATSAKGGTWASCGAELGSEAALDRLGQINPKILFTVDAYYYKGKKFDQLGKVKKLIESIPSLERVIVFPYVNEKPDIIGMDKTILYADFITENNNNELKFESVDFSHPQYIMFSSGTTGKPKCMVQSAGGVLINHLKELILATDLKRDDKLMYLSSPSWMMWNWTMSALGVGSTIVLYDGNPLYPTWKELWQIIQDHKVTVFGCSASYLHYLKSIGAAPSEEFDLSNLKQISQTGSSLSEEGFEWVYDKIKSELHFNSISGGTDINGCFASGSPTLPVYSGQLQARALGMKVFAYNDKEEHIYDEQGELVCELPSPSMPIYFWGDKDNKKYQDAYFGFFKKHVWRHGDYITIDSKTGGVQFFGRSDSVLKPSGVRIGTSEIYSIVEEFDEIVDSLAIGQQWNNDQRIILFVQLTEGRLLDEDLKNKIRSELRTKASPRHVPARIIATPDIPYTFSGKKVESAITNLLHGRKIVNKGAMRNPESLIFYENMLEDLQSR